MDVARAISGIQLDGIGLGLGISGNRAPCGAIIRRNNCPAGFENDFYTKLRMRGDGATHL